MRSVLVTGFEPFADKATNPSELAVRQLAGRTIRKHHVEIAILPVVFDDAITALRSAIRRHEPALVICVGEAGGRTGISVERIAINIDDARIADNAGAQPIDRTIARRGPAAYWSTLPIKAITAALRRADIPAEVSQTAGTFVCNHVFYGLMHALHGTKIRGGFIHVPFARGQGKPSLPLATIVHALDIAIATAIRVKRDRRLRGGAEH
ncbi:MAG: pyroglutamyl-peptidase I [Kofleriaceae bacterium]